MLFIFTIWNLYPQYQHFTVEEDKPELCRPSPCGPNSQCQNVNDQAVCSCLLQYIGTPPNCRPECVVNTECNTNLACVNQKCKDPCLGTCGRNAQCKVIHHSPICSCGSGLTGDPFVICFPTPSKPLSNNDNVALIKLMKHLLLRHCMHPCHCSSQ